MEMIQQYIIALTNLYGIVPREKVIEIFNDQNETKLGLNEFEQFNEEEFNNNFVYIHENYFVHEAVQFVGLFDEILEKQTNKPYYIPEKKQLLKYTDDLYIEKNEQYKNLKQYIKENFFHDDPERTINFVNEIYDSCRNEYSLSLIMDEISTVIEFEDMAQANEFVQLIAELSNNTRIWSNRGHTPNELFEKYERPKLKPLPDEPYDINQHKDIGRNDPCYCGSGKKYKKCCLRKDEQEKYNR